MIDEKSTNGIPENEDISNNKIQNSEPTDDINKNETNEETNIDAESLNENFPKLEANEETDFENEINLLEALPHTDEENTDSLNCDNDNENSENEKLDEEEVIPREQNNTESESEKNPEPEIKSRRIDSLFDFVELFVFTLAAVFIITSFFFRYSIVEGSSMVGTLYEGDKLILSSFMYEPEQGDVIVVYSDQLDKVIVKRVIATGGQTVRITETDVYVDGKKLVEPYVYTADSGYIGQYRYEESVRGEIKVPEGEIYVMGDHRNISDDSRAIGTIDEDAIIGKVIFRFAPFDKFGKID